MFQVYCLAGGVAGVTEALVLNPFEVVKVAQQANKGIYTQVCELGASNSFFVGSTLPVDSSENIYRKLSHDCEREDNCITHHPIYLSDSSV